MLAACTNNSQSEPASGEPIQAAGKAVSGIAFVSERDGNKEVYLIQPDSSGLIRLTDDPAIDADPAWSPDGRLIAFRSRRAGSTDIFIMSADGSHPTNLIQDPADSMDDEFYPGWSPDGETLALITDRYNLGGCSWHRLALMPVTGGKVNIEHVEIIEGNQRSLAWSPDVRYIAFSNHCGQNESISLYSWDKDTSKVKQLTTHRSQNIYPSWSHDGHFLAFSSTRDGNAEIYVLEIATGTLSNLTNHPARDLFPSWCPDDTQIAFTSDRDGNDEIYLMDADGSNPKNLTHHPGRDFHPAWSPTP